MRKASVIRVLALGLGLALGLCGLAASKSASAQIAVGISVRVGPPALPVYAQPICPGPNYIWTPGYWAWDPGEQQYYWVPGTWVLAPQPGYLWTPGWWGFAGGVYVWHAGYWGPHVGFYGGINYGYGYFGNGFVGGEWRGDHFFYNTAVSRVNVTVVRNVYVNRTVVRNVNTRVSYNGGPHGINARPTAQEQRWDSERHVGPTANQRQHVNEARGDRTLFYNQNHGRPPVAATQRPTQFSGPGVVRGGNQFRPPQNQNRGRQPNNRAPENRNFNRPQPNNARPENRNFNRPQPNNRPENRSFNEPRNEGRPGGQPHAQPAPRGGRPEAQPHNEPRGNPGGHGGGGHDGGHDGGGRNDGGR